MMGRYRRALASAKGAAGEPSLDRKYCANMNLRIGMPGFLEFLNILRTIYSLSGQRFGSIARRNAILLHCDGASLSARGMRFVKVILLSRRNSTLADRFNYAHCLGKAKRD